VRSRLLKAKGLLLTACLLWNAAPLLAQRQVIATSVPVTPTQQPLPAPTPQPSGIQLATFVPEPPPSTQPTLPRSILPPTVLSSERESPTPTTPLKTTPPPSVAAPATPTAPATPANVLAVEVVGVGRVQQGQPLPFEIVLRNRGSGPLAQIHVEVPLPDGVRVAKTDPTTTSRDGRLVWDVPQLEEGGERRLKVEVNLGSTIDLEVRPSASFSTGRGWHARVMRPPLTIEQSADRVQVMRGETIHFAIRLTNNSEESIQNLVLYDTLPSGLHNATGRKMSKKLDPLRPNEVKTITLEATAVESGTFSNQVETRADLGVEAKSTLEVVVTEPKLLLHVEGPKQCRVGTDVDFQIEVANPSGVAARNVRLLQTLPPALEVVSASTGASLDKTQGALVWSLSDLNAGQRQTAVFRCRANQSGIWSLSTAAFSQNVAGASSQTELRTEETAALRLEVQAREGSLKVGTEKVYRLHVFCDGAAPCGGLQLSAILPEALTPLTCEGPTVGNINAQKVTFAPLQRIEGGSDVVYAIRVRARQGGKGILRLELASDKVPSILKELSIQVEDEGGSGTKSENGKPLSSETLR
jgi:uncharacterized repeat protein (TIGR01451 family)